MELIVIGANFRNCSIELRETFLNHCSEPRLLQLKRLLAEAVVLNTCHRVEVYGVVPQPQAIGAVRAALGVGGGEGHVYLYQGQEVVHHLFRVGAGLESLIPGEAQILGQVRQAAERARQESLAGPVLSALFRHAVSCGKQVRSQAKLAGRWATLGTAAADLAQQALGGLKGKSALLLGAGKTTELAIQALRRYGIGNLWLASRTLERTEVAAHRLGAQPIPWEDMPWALAQCHLLISATTAPQPVVSTSLVAGVMGGRDFPLAIIDLALPRDVEPEAGQVPGVTLWNVDQLPAPGQDSPSQEEITKAQLVVTQKVEQFYHWFRERQAIAEVVALYRRAERVRSREVEKTLTRLGSLSPEQRDKVHAMTRSIIMKLLHPPVACYKRKVAQGDGAPTRTLMAELFGLDRKGG